MKVWFKRATLALLGLVLLLAAAAAIYAWRTLPSFDGTHSAPGLTAPVTVARDASDVTHIFAESPRDAWYTLGRTHAQERGWQLELQRRTMHGELSAILGEATVNTDKLMRTLGIMPAARRQLANLPQDTRDALQAYAQGVNDFHAETAQALSPEFLILRTQPGQWEPADSVGWALMMALDLGGNWGTEFARLVAAQTLDNERLWQLFPPYPGEDPPIDIDLPALYHQLGVYRPAATASVDLPETPRSALQAWAQALVTDTGNIDGKGSNNWVVAGSHTASGKPLLANDPHLGLAAPALWYFARLHAPGLDVTGATLPGLPFVVLGRTRGAAWAFTNTGPDVQDLYLEQIDPDNPAQYRTPQGWAPFETRQETIVVRDAPNVDYTVRTTRNGPVLSDAQPQYGRIIDTSRYVLALRWSALEDDNQTVYAGLLMNTAQSVDELIAAGAFHHSPMQSVLMADTTGNVGFHAFGKAPLRRADNDILGIAPAPGWDDRYAWDSWLPYADNPRSDVDAGFLATANQRVTPLDYPFFIGQDWAVPYRQMRIEELLATTARHDLASMRDIQADIVSLATRRLMPFLLDTPSDHALAPAAQRVMAGFDGTMGADSAAPLIFAAWADELARGLIVPHLGEGRFAMLYGRRNFRATVEYALETDDPWWCAPVGCEAQSSAALGRALDRLQTQYGSNVDDWRWGDAHPALSAHRPFGNVAALAPIFDVTVPTGGDGYTVNVGQYNLTGDMPFASQHAASLRAIYDLSEGGKSVFIYQTGQSGNVFSPRYRDMRDTWAEVEYRPLIMPGPPTADDDAWAHRQQLVP